MNIRTGYFRADLALNKSSSHRECGAGEVIFSEGDPASGLFIVLRGNVEIVKKTGAGEVRVAEVEPDGVFGEMGLITEGGLRAAMARALEPSLLLEVRNNPLQMLKDLGEISGAMVLLKQVICVLGDWLRSQNDSAGSAVGASDGLEIPDPDAREAAEVVESHLPKGFFKRSPKRVLLSDGQYLCQQGDSPNGFYFIHSGALDILKKEDANAGEVHLGQMRGPTVAGEIGYFSGEPRLVSLRASEEVAYTHFSGDEFEKLVDKRPEEALEVLFAAAQSIVSLIHKQTD